MPIKKKNQTVFNGPDLHPRQQDFAALVAQHRNSLAFGSSRASKSYGIVAMIVGRALRYHRLDQLVLRLTGNSVKTTIWKTFEAVMETFGLGPNQVQKNLTDLTITFLDTGSTIVFSGVQDEERIAKILGAEYGTIFINEATEIDFPTYEIVASRLNGNWFDDNGVRCQLKFVADCNPTTKKHWLYQLFIEKVVPGSNKPLFNPEQFAALHFDRFSNPLVDPSYYDSFENATSSAQRRFLNGEWSDEIEGSLFSEDDLNKNRTNELPTDWKLIAIAIDPAMTNTPTSDETGIFVVGCAEIDGTDHYYPLEDLSGRYHERDWATKAIDAYYRWGAGMIVVEVNQGGNQNLYVLRSVDVRPNIITVRAGAGQGKNDRARPIATLMKEGRIHHPLDPNQFKELEGQMLRMTGDLDRKRGKSPDRLDAYVYAISELLTGKGPAKPVVVGKVAGYFR